MKINRKKQHGGAAVEFALVAILFVTLLMAIVGFGHWAYTMEMAADATRAGARIAVVCDLNDTKIRQAVQARVPQLSLADAQVAVEYVPAGCNKGSCQSVRVSLTNASYNSWIPFLPTVLPMPPLTTSLPRESLESVNAAGELNPSCI
jgi:Flp pilus assembly protein TadG